ncbi:MAG: phosphoribosylaminoimidazolesuccinocarboxamide synthase [bacterium]|nr:phosphoribosylaminoimidazolesuccinocarboxamide synthase [bacterium]MCP4799154.1 phosphoribosylaminoimidazolesuccinocarboxamide synthase [bacterium]
MQSLKSTTDLGLNPDFKGKVREIFDLGDTLLIVATDRISAFDVVMDQVVPGRGIILSVMTLAWLDYFNDIPNHLITADADLFPAPFCDFKSELAGRSMLVSKADAMPVECIARGYITGSGWKSYLSDGSICGHQLPENLLKSQRLDHPLYTPSTKAEEGHDENISFAETIDLVGQDDAAALKEMTMRLYSTAAEYAASKGVLIADTKFEFGNVNGVLTLIDEVLTPDSSRFWPSAEHVPGQEPPSWDKQILRNYLETLDWDHEYPPPVIDNDILVATSDRYLEVLNILFPDFAETWKEVL